MSTVSKSTYGTETENRPPHVLFGIINETLRAIVDPVVEYASKMAQFLYSCYALRKQSLFDNLM
jgi:hypothetical protein